MPLFYLRRLTGSKRSESANRQLARFLAFVAGATNAGGLLAVGQYTSHMTGIISTMADNLAAGRIPIVLTGLSAVLSFLGGAFLTTVIVRWGHRRGLNSAYALPLVLEAALLVVFGLTGHRLEERGHVFLNTVVLLCFTMGLQNAMITKISNAVIRTTHLTGMVTDIGISLGRIISPASGSDLPLRSEVTKLRLHASIIALFFLGGFVGALGFKHVGFLFTLPLAAIVLLLAVVPVVDDVRQYRHLAQ